MTTGGDGVPPEARGRRGGGGRAGAGADRCAVADWLGITPTSRPDALPRYSAGVTK